ncbi:unnamed protein product [Arabis nemorensis]|uniref:Uncharacterized protein n=1 Tax=Arabis nemorensis TaxID=586526 RepID=A0A565CCD7_9BRAS|nr:unnamed protein product [Arabis nemorensis]
MRLASKYKKMLKSNSRLQLYLCLFFKELRKQLCSPFQEKIKPSKISPETLKK